METLIHADIFFFVTTIAVVLIGALLVVVIVYIVRILNDLHSISAIVRKETGLLADDLDHMREEIKREGLATSVFAFIAGLFQARKQRSKERKQRS